MAELILPKTLVRDNYFERQRKWERHYLKIASKNGCIMFWLPKEEEDIAGNVYGDMTRFELGQWANEYTRNSSINLYIGMKRHFQKLIF